MRACSSSKKLNKTFELGSPYNPFFVSRGVVTGCRMIDPQWPKIINALQTNTAPVFNYHRYWAQAEIALTLGLMVSIQSETPYNPIQPTVNIDYIGYNNTEQFDGWKLTIRIYPDKTINITYQQTSPQPEPEPEPNPIEGMFAINGRNQIKQ